MSVNVDMKQLCAAAGSGIILPQQYPHHSSNGNLRRMFCGMSRPSSQLSSSLCAVGSSHNNNNNNRANNVVGEPLATANHDPSDTNTVLYWAYAARLSCIVALIPMLLFANNEKITKWAACLHLLLTPVTSFFLLNFSYARCCGEMRSKMISCLLSGVCFALGNSAAVVLLASDDTKLVIVWVNGLLSAALCLGSCQLLMVLHKENVVRVMACTAAAVMVVVLAVLGSAAPLNMTKRFFQSAAIPFVILFLETSRLKYTSPRQQQPEQQQTPA